VLLPKGTEAQAEHALYMFTTRQVRFEKTQVESEEVLKAVYTRK